MLGTHLDEMFLYSPQNKAIHRKHQQERRILLEQCSDPNIKASPSAFYPNKNTAT